MIDFTQYTQENKTKAEALLIELKEKYPDIYDLFSSLGERGKSYLNKYWDFFMNDTNNVDDFVERFMNCMGHDSYGYVADTCNTKVFNEATERIIKSQNPYKAMVKEAITYGW